MSNLDDYIVISTVGSKDYLTKVSSYSPYGAEHEVLDLSICGKHTYSVTSCIAYDDKSIFSENFPCIVFHSQPVSFNELKEIINRRNDEILKSDEKETRISELEIQIKTLQSELELLKE